MNPSQKLDSSRMNYSGGVNNSYSKPSDRAFDNQGPLDCPTCGRTGMRAFGPKGERAVKHRDRKTQETTYCTERGSA